MIKEIKKYFHKLFSIKETVLTFTYNLKQKFEQVITT